MKFIYSIIALMFCLILSGCFSPDDGFGRSISSLTIQDAITFTNEKQYLVGDTVFFELKFSRYVKEEGYSELLDIYETTNDQKFGYSFGFQKFSEFSNSYEWVNIDPKYVIAEKTDSDGFYFYNDYSTVASLNTEQDTYESKVGVILAEEGMFRFDFDNIYIGNSYGYGYTDDKIHIDISHSFTGNDAIDTEFTVTD